MELFTSLLASRQSSVINHLLNTWILASLIFVWDRAVIVEWSRLAHFHIKLFMRAAEHEPSQANKRSSIHEWTLHRHFYYSVPGLCMEVGYNQTTMPNMVSHSARNYLMTFAIVIFLGSRLVITGAATSRNILIIRAEIRVAPVWSEIFVSRVCIPGWSRCPSRCWSPAPNIHSTYSVRVLSTSETLPLLRVRANVHWKSSWTNRYVY